jgi:DNA-binding Lrp family transcriptional regulator
LFANLEQGLVMLQPMDIPVALGLMNHPGATFDSLSHYLGISKSTAHNSVKRLAEAGLVREDERKVNRHALVEFIEHGIRYAFPPKRSGRGRGVPTAFAGPSLAEEILSDEAVVWPHPSGSAWGDGLEPLYDHAPELPSRCPELYDMLTLVDAIRIGRARERRIASEQLRERLDYRSQIFG